jgi:excisionase family DNA binding protein
MEKAMNGRSESTTRDYERGKVQSHHLERAAYVYVRQSSLFQVQHHTESGRLQYERLEQAMSLGWPRERIVLVDGDQGVTGTLPDARAAFGELAGAVARGEVGIVLSLESARLARNGPDWAKLLFLCRWSETLIADRHGIYDLTSHTDRMVLGIRGQISELEIDISIERMHEARRSKAARGELVGIVPAGYELDEQGQIVRTPDEAVAEVIATVFGKILELGSARQVWLWWLGQGLKYPVRRIAGRTHPVLWKTPTYRCLPATLKNPIYAGAYAHGRSRQLRELDAEEPGKLRVRTARSSDPDQWSVLIHDHHFAYVSWKRFLDIQQRLRANGSMKEGERQGPVREGKALLQGLVRCGRCGRQMAVACGGSAGGAHGRPPQYRCAIAREQRDGKTCQIIGSRRIDDVVVGALRAVLEPASIDVALKAEELAVQERESSARVWELQIEKAEYEAQRAERQYHAIEPENRLVARSLERQWNERLQALETVRAQAATACRRSPALTSAERERLGRLACDLDAIWSAPTTTNRDKKALLRCLVEEVQILAEAEHCRIRIVWKGGAVTDHEIARRARPSHATDEDTVELLRRLAEQFDDVQIARILNRQGRRTGRGNPFTRSRVATLRNAQDIPFCPQPAAADSHERAFTADEAANELGVTSRTIHRWLRDGLLPGEQVTVGAPWRIYLPKEVRRRLTCGDAPEGWVGLTEAAQRLGLSKQHVVYLVRTGKLPAMRTKVGTSARWRIDVSTATCAAQQELFDPKDNANGEDA